MTSERVVTIGILTAVLFLLGRRFRFPLAVGYTIALHVLAYPIWRVLVWWGDRRS